MIVHDARFRAMGTDCHIRIVGADDTAWARAEVDRLAGLWTRFAPSELIGVGEQPVAVDPDTRLLIERAVAGYDLTSGAFNPFLIGQIEAAGYDRDFDDITVARVSPAERGRRGSVSIDGDVVSSTQPIDSGGIGKGLAADLVAERLVARGASGALVNLGGDLRCAGSAPQDRWRITIDTPVPLPQPLSVRLDQGAVCTSTPLLRRWRREDGAQMHHLLDPRTGQPLVTDIACVSVIAPQAWLGEVLCKAVLLLPDARDLLRAHDAAALVVSAEGVMRQL